MAYGDLYNANQVKVGNALGWLQPYDPATPATLPETSVALWGEWQSPWTSLGATESGYTISPDVSLQQIYIEEQATPVATEKTQMNLGVSVSLAEDTLQNMAYDLGGEISTDSTAGTVTLTLTDQLQEWAFGLEMANFNGKARRVLIPRVTVTGGGETALRRAEAKRLYPLTITSNCKPTEIKIVEPTQDGGTGA